MVPRTAAACQPMVSPVPVKVPKYSGMFMVLNAPVTDRTKYFKSHPITMV